MRLLADDVADVVDALEALLFAGKRKRHEVPPFIVMIDGFESARATLVSVAAPSRSMLEDLLAKTQAALRFVYNESAPDPQITKRAALELAALIEALGQRLSDLPTSVHARDKHPVLLVS